MTAPTTSAVHGPELGGLCRCRWKPTIPEGTSDADAVAMAVEQRAAHYDEVGYIPVDPPVTTREIGAPNRIVEGDDDIESMSATLPAVVDRIAARAAAAGRVAEDEPDTEEAERQRRFQEAWEAFRPTAMFDGATVEQLAPDARDEADRWLSAPTGNLIISGTDLGTGKTFMAIAVCFELMRRGHTCRWGPVVEILEALRPGGHLTVEDFTRPDFVLLDDIGAEKASEWSLERLYLIVNRRWLDQKPIIVTTNVPVEEIIENVGARTWDRIRDGARGIQISGASRRKPAL